MNKLPESSFLFQRRPISLTLCSSCCLCQVIALKPKSSYCSDAVSFAPSRVSDLGSCSDSAMDSKLKFRFPASSSRSLMLTSCEVWARHPSLNDIRQLAAECLDQ